MSIEMIEATQFPRIPSSMARQSVLLAGFGEHETAEMRALLGAHCEVAAVRSVRDMLVAVVEREVAVLCVGPLFSPIEARHVIAELENADGAVPLVLLTATGPDPAMFQDLIDADRLFYLSPGEPPPGDLAALVRAALDRRGMRAAEPPTPALLAALTAARRVAAQPDLASAGDLLQLAIADSIDADRAYCLLYDAAGETLWSRAAGLTGEARSESSAVGLVSFVARTGRPVRIDRAAGDPRFEREADDPLGDRCEPLLAVPIRGSHPEVLAVLCAVRDAGREPFSAADEAALVLLAETVAPSLAQRALAASLDASNRGDAGERMAGIFREEALEYHAAAGSREGDWLRLAPRWTSATTWLLVALVAAFLLFASFSSIDESSTGPAVVRLTGRTEIPAGQEGFVTAVDVHPGERVTKGRVLVRFESAREAAELARIEREWELQLVERLRDLTATASAQALIGLRAERDLARSRLEARVVRAPADGIVGDLRCRPEQHVTPGDILLSLHGPSSRAVLIAMLPGEHRPQLRSGMTLNVELRGYRQSPQRLTIAAVADEVVGAEEAKRLLGPEVATAVPLNGAVVRVEAYFPRDTFNSRGQTYVLHDGMWGSAEVAVRSEPLLVALVPGLRDVLERLHG
jgi:multidrug resistance efflux pump